MRCTRLIGTRTKFDSTGLKSKDDRATIALYNCQDDEAPSCGTREESATSQPLTKQLKTLKRNSRQNTRETHVIMTTHSLTRYKQALMLVNQLLI